MTLLLSVTVKIALLTLGGLAATAMLRRLSAAMRHWVLATTMFCCLCVPAVELLLPSWSISLPATWLAPSATSSLQLSSEAPAPRADVQNAPVDETNHAGTSGRLSPAATLVGIWIGGALVGLLVLSVGLLRLRSLAARSEPLSAGAWRSIADDIAARYGIRRSVRLLRCPHATLLATWGLIRPTVLLPEGAETWTEDRIRVVLRHELAHIHRGDWAVSLTASVLKAVYWFNPLVWLACRQLRHESERACDDLVLGSGISASEYATHLLDVARESALRRHPWSPAIAIAHRSMLEGRIRAMLNGRLNREPLTTFMRATTVAAIATVAVSVGVVTLSGDSRSTAAPDVHMIPAGTLPLLNADATPGAISPARLQAAAGAQTQARGGTIEGVLYDQFGGLLPGVSLKLTQVATGSAQSSSTSRAGAFSFSGLAAGDYDLVTDLPGFVSVKNTLHAEPGATVRRYISLPIGVLQETIQVTCAAADLRTSQPTAPSASATPGASQGQPTGPNGTEPKIAAAFTGGVGGQIRVPRKVSHANPVCPTGVTPETTLVRLEGRIGIDGLFSDLHDAGSKVQPAYVTSALDAARKWVFTPTLLNGAPIEANMRLMISYAWSN
ncbi:MAG TPA: M56 family metallopeptidase [Vicinamibacterales bacterium]|nr:M56 family metallopeptidase [Vicinamibacterales bacterium]